MLRQNGNISLDYLAKEAFLSTKQFKWKFYEQTGVNPEYPI
jgi:AraC-like DNA-binding protein